MDIQSIIETMSGNMLAKLNRIRLFLNEGRASVMVGAGFSRNAEKEAHVVMKDWNSLAEDIYEQLYAKRPTAKDLAFKTPMRLASLLASNIGRSGLDLVIKDSLPDDLITPGKLHYQLMELNWRDVFTTNYDTLLERAAEKSGRYYKVVTSKEMLLYKSSPRIIKLHGSFPDKTPFLMTEEEYRTYPADHPEFVNTVRQALVESVFCLVGFSGDDPNFTSWQAWLKDVMGNYASPTYLITFDEKYDDSFKKLMMSRGVEVLNLAEIKGLENHKSALEFFFSYLGQKKNVNWKPYIGYSRKVDDIDSLIQQMREIRESYPGWFVLPKEYYRHFKDMETCFPYFQNVVDEITDSSKKEKLLFELDWRAEISLSLKDHDWYVQSIEDLVERYGSNPFSKELMDLALSLLRIYRHYPEKKEKKVHLHFLLKNQLQDMSEGQKRRYYYTMACNLLSELDYETLELLLREWQPLKNDYDGIIFKALVIAEMKGVTEASVMIGEAVERISRTLLKESSEELLSRKAALDFLSSFYSNEGRPDIPSKYSFLALSDKFMGSCRMSNPSGENISHGFAIGSVRRSWNLRSGYNPHFVYPYRYLLLCERYGLPYGLPKSTVDDELLAEIVGYLSDFNLEYAIPIALRSGSRKVAESALSRKVLANVNREHAEFFANSLLSIVKKTTPTDALVFRKEEVLLPMLCRLSTKVSGTLKLDIFKEVNNHFKSNNSSAIADVYLLYDALKIDELTFVINFLFSRDFEKNTNGSDFPFPRTGYKTYSPKKEHLKIVLDGLKSNDENIRSDALVRVELMMYSNIKVNEKKLLSNAVHEWRKTANNDCYHYWESFAIVNADKSEIVEVSRFLHETVETVLTTEYIFNESSLDVSHLTNLLNKVSTFSSLLSESQKTGLFVKIAKILDDNKLIISHDDSVWFMGGLRQPCSKLFDAIQKFVDQVDFTDKDKDACKILYRSLSLFLNDGLPIRLTMEILNNHCLSVKGYEMRGIIENALFNVKRVVVIDSLKALLLHAKNGGSVQTVYQKIIHFCTMDITELTYAYVDCLAFSDLSKLSKKTKSELGNMMIALYDRIPKCNLPAEYKVDLLHSCAVLLKTVQNETEVSAIKDASKLWIQYVKDSDTFNDVKRGYYE